MSHLPPPGPDHPEDRPPQQPPGSGQPLYGQPDHGQPGYGQRPYAQPGYGEPGHGQPPYGQPPYGQPGYGPPVPSPPTAGKATTSLVLGVVSLVFCGLLTGIPAIVMGFMARKEIRDSDGALSGEGLALGGIITGFLGTLWSLVLGAVLIFALALSAEVVKQVDEACEEFVSPSSGAAAEPFFTEEDCS